MKRVGRQSVSPERQVTSSPSQVSKRLKREGSSSREVPPSLPDFNRPSTPAQSSAFALQPRAPLSRLQKPGSPGPSGREPLDGLGLSRATTQQILSELASNLGEDEFHSSIYLSATGATFFESMLEAQKGIARALLKFHETASTLPTTYQQAVAIAESTGSIHVQVGEQFDQEGATGWIASDRKHLIEIDVDIASDEVEDPAIVELNAILTMVIEVHNAAARDSFLALETRARRGEFKSSEGSPELSSVEKQLLRHAGDQGAVTYAREVLKIEHQSIHRTFHSAQELISHRVPGADFLLSKTKVSSQLPFAEFFADQVKKGQAQQYLDQYDELMSEQRPE